MLHAELKNKVVYQNQTPVFQKIMHRKANTDTDYNSEEAVQVSLILQNPLSDIFSPFSHVFIKQLQAQTIIESFKPIRWAIISLAHGYLSYAHSISITVFEYLDHFQFKTQRKKSKVFCEFGLFTHPLFFQPLAELFLLGQPKLTRGQTLLQRKKKKKTIIPRYELQMEQT